MHVAAGKLGHSKARLTVPKIVPRGGLCAFVSVVPCDAKTRVNTGESQFPQIPLNR